MSNSGAKYLFTSVQGNDTVSLLYITVKKSQSVPVTDPVVAQRVGRSIALLFHERGTRRGEWSAARPGRTLPPVKTRYPLYRRLCGPQGRSGRAENLAPPGFNTRTVHPLAQSLYRLSYPAHIYHCTTLNLSQRAVRYSVREQFHLMTVQFRPKYFGNNVSGRYRVFSKPCGVHRRCCCSLA